jgi:hypothetical protein
MDTEADIVGAGPAVPLRTRDPGSLSEIALVGCPAASSSGSPGLGA